MESSLKDLVPFAGMITSEFTDVGLTTLSKAAMTKGMSPFVYVVYNNALGTLLLLPFFISDRKKRPPLTFTILCRLFILALIGLCFVEILGSFGIRYSSPTLSSAMANLIPAFTFALATIFRMEKLNLRSWSSRAKLLGTIVSISGAFTVTLYKGPPIIIFFSTPLQLSLSPQPNWILGGILLAVTCLLAAIWNVLQAATVKKYPSQMTVVFFYCFFGTIQCALFSLIAERDPSAWRLKPDIELVSIVYSGVFGSVFRTCIHTWGIHKKGPLYVAMFRPLGIVIAVVMGVSFLGDTLHVGSVVGAIVISSGFYAVIWGKSKEEKMSNENEVVSLGSSSLNSPLLRNKDTDISKFPTLLLQ